MEEIAYRPQNVRETLVELIDTSELAIDLAYAAALYGHAGLAQEVLELESRVTSLQYPAKIAIMLAAKRADDAERLVGVLQILDAAVEITNAAADIAGIVLNDIGLPAEVRSALPDADEVVMRATVADASPVVGRSLADLGWGLEMGVHVSAVRRDTEWRVAPGDDLVLQPGDVVIGQGPDAGVTTVYEQVATHARSREATEQSDIEELQQAATTVIQLKDIAELAVGLSYSAALFDDDALAAEVVELEGQSNRLNRALETWVIEAGEEVSEPQRLRGLLHLATASETICDTARDIADIVLREADIHPVFGQAISESDDLITATRITGGSELAGQPLNAIELEARTGMSVMAIHRDDDWLLSPSGDTELVAGDVLIARGPERGARRLQSWASG